LQREYKVSTLKELEEKYNNELQKQKDTKALFEALGLNVDFCDSQATLTIPFDIGEEAAVSARATLLKLYPNATITLVGSTPHWGELNEYFGWGEHHSYGWYLLSDDERAHEVKQWSAPTLRGRYSNWED
jgi:hypothetical protein